MDPFTVIFITIVTYTVDVIIYHSSFCKFVHDGKMEMLPLCLLVGRGLFFSLRKRIKEQRNQ